jgi:hypothetical protein
MEVWANRSLVNSLNMKSASSVDNRTAEKFLVFTHYASPVLLLIFFLVAFTTHSIVTAPKDSTVAASKNVTGPGGKPLPRSKTPKAKAQRKSQVPALSRARVLLFQWISAGALLTFVANAVVVICHALLDRKDNWWCGQHVAVGPHILTFISYAPANRCRFRSMWLPLSLCTHSS